MTTASESIDAIDDDTLDWRPADQYGTLVARYAASMGVFEVLLTRTIYGYFLEIVEKRPPEDGAILSEVLTTQELLEAKAEAWDKLQFEVRRRFELYQANHPYFFSNMLPVPK